MTPGLLLFALVDAMLEARLIESTMRAMMAYSLAEHAMWDLNRQLVCEMLGEWRALWWE